MSERKSIIEELKEEDERKKKESGSTSSTSSTSSTIDKKFNEPNLIIHILNELSKAHLQDNNQKLSAFLCCCTSYLEPNHLHKSMAFLGDSSVGKDNMIKTVLKHFPKKDWIFLTNATASTMEDDIQNYKIIAYSEFNTQREKGANTHLVEIIKQMTEGGTSSIKKDLKTGYKTTKHIQQEQKTVFFGTTDAERDEELETRFILNPIEGHASKTQAINNNTLEWASGLLKEEKSYSWIAKSIIGLKYNKVLMPYLVLLKDKFDSHNPRSSRDVKRLIAFTAGMAWIYQKQRDIDNEGYIISEPFDFLAAWVIAGDFFQQTYKGLGDTRLQEIIDLMEQYKEEYMDKHPSIEKSNIDVPRTYLQEQTGKSVNTIKKRVKSLSNLSILRWTRNENNIPHYQAYQKGVKNPLLPVNFNELKALFDTFKGVKNKKSTVYNYSVILEELNKLAKSNDLASTFGKIDGLKLTGLTPLEDISPFSFVLFNKNIPNITNKTDNQSKQIIHHICSICKETPCKGEDKRGNPLCEGCLATYQLNIEKVT